MNVFGLFRTGQDQRSKVGYRTDIDGLRAIAVVAVVLFHLDFRIVGGGFVGVDIFFVISGYLIGRSILQQRRERRFSLTDFYQKRLRRIAPALVAMLSVVTFAAGFILLPRPMADYGASLVAAVLSLANVHFWSETDYFAAAAHEQPLLHTWSLGVEEQFYLLLPIVLLATARARRYELAWLGAIAVASLAASIAVTKLAPTANFYLIPFRAWELLFGVFAAELRWRALQQRRLLRELLALLSIAVLGGCILFYRASMPFPGATAIPPVAATAVLLAIGGQGSSLVSRALGLKPAVWIGLISYSLYLWHWPIIVLMKQWLPAAWLRVPDRGAALAIMTVLAILSWWLVERPFRSSRISDRAIWWFSGLSSLALVLAGIGLVATKGLPQRFTPEIVSLARWLDRPQSQPLPCFVGLYATPGTFASPQCLRRDPARPDVLILGDSHSNHLKSGLVRRYPGINFLQAGAAGCRVTIDPAPDETPTCRAFRSRVFGELLVKDPPRHVLLALFWGEDALEVLGPTVDWMQRRGINVIIGGPGPRYELPLPQILAIARLRGDPTLVERLRIPGTAAADARFAAFAAEHGAGYMSSYSALCSRGTCVTEASPGVPIQFDSHHLNDAGSLLVAEAFPYRRIGAAGAR